MTRPMNDRTPTEVSPEMLFAAMQAYFGEENYDGRCLGVSAALDAEAHDCMRMAITAALAASPPAPAAEPVAWAYEFHEFGDIWKRHVILNRPDGGANPPTKHHGSPVRNVTPLYTHPLDAAAIRAEARREGAIAGWNACRTSIYAVCEDVDKEADAAGKHEGEHARGYASGMARAAKSIARGFGAMQALDDDNLIAALADKGEAE